MKVVSSKKARKYSVSHNYYNRVGDDFTWKKSELKRKNKIFFIRAFLFEKIEFEDLSSIFEFS